MKWLLVVLATQPYNVSGGYSIATEQVSSYAECRAAKESLEDDWADTIAKVRARCIPLDLSKGVEQQVSVPTAE